MYTLRIKNREDQQLTEAQWLWVIKMLSGAKGWISLLIDWVNIGYFQCSDIRVEKNIVQKNQFDEYEKNSQAYHENYLKKEEWTQKELAKLTDDQKKWLYELCLYMYPSFSQGTHGEIGVKKMCSMLLRYIRKCPHDRIIRKLFFKPIHGYTEYELRQRFWDDLDNMEITLTEVMPEKDVSFLAQKETPIS